MQNEPVQSIAISWPPCFPDANVLPDCPVSTARNIAQYPVEKEIFESLVTLRSSARNFDYGIVGGVQIRHHESRAGKAGRLMNEEMRPFVIVVVR